MEDNEDFILKDITSLTELLSSNILEKPYLDISLEEFPLTLYKLASLLYKEENVDVYFTIYNYYHGEDTDSSTALSKDYVTIEEFNNLKIDHIIKEYSLFLLIKFKEITLRNSGGGEHLMTDLYVKIPFDIYTNKNYVKYYKIGTPSAIRMSATPVELENGFSFSHISEWPGYFGKFCLGSGDFGNSVRVLYTEALQPEWLIKDLFSIIYLLEGYVSWESLSGGPYKRMGTLYKKDSENIHLFLEKSNGLRTFSLIEIIKRSEYFKSIFDKYKVLGRYNVKGILIEFNKIIEDKEKFNSFFKEVINALLQTPDDKEIKESYLTIENENKFIEEKIDFLKEIRVLAEYDLTSFNIIVPIENIEYEYTVPVSSIEFKGESIPFKVNFNEDNQKEQEGKYSLNLATIYNLIKEFDAIERIEYIKSELKNL